MSLIKIPFKSFFHGGFECSSHCRMDGVRLDLLASTLHDKHAYTDYQVLASYNVNTVRDGVRWHLIETRPYYYDWSSFLNMLYAARDVKTQVIWDLCHYGWPDYLNIWGTEFVKRFTRFAAEVSRIVKNETSEPPFYIPINEISFWAWAGGEVGYLNPCARGRGFELKQQLVRASISAIEAIKHVDSRARFIQAEPAINVVNSENFTCDEAYQQNESQYQAWDLLSGKLWPGLGGQDDFVDIIGINYYPYNQWFLNGEKILADNLHYLRFADILIKNYQRYNRPIYIAETGTEGVERAKWFKYICNEIWFAINSGVPVVGACIYPVIDYPGWDDNRHCDAGLLGAIDPLVGYRPVYDPLLQELIYQQKFVACSR